MRTFSILVITFVVGCVVPAESVVEQHYCTQEDIDNGTCSDPGGGSAPYTLPEDTDAYAHSVIVTGGFSPTSPASRICSQVGHCSVHIDLWDGFIDVSCTLFVDGTEQCEAWRCWPVAWPGTGYVCTQIG